MDNNPKANKPSQQDVITWFSSNHGTMKMSITDAKTADEAIVALQRAYFDLIVTDWDLGRNKPDGLSLVKRIRDMSYFTDIIFYTRKPTLPPAVELDVFKAGFAYSVRDDQLVSMTQGVIQERLGRFEKVSFLRGMVISAFIVFETKLNELLLRYFQVHDRLAPSFKASILENRNISFGSKRDAVLMILFGTTRMDKKPKTLPPFDKLDQKAIRGEINGLMGVEKSRNLLAHCVVLDENHLQVMTMGEIHDYKRADIIRIIEGIRECSGFIDTLTQCIR